MLHYILTFAMGVAVGALLLIRRYEMDKRPAPRLRCPEAASSPVDRGEAYVEAEKDSVTNAPKETAQEPQFSTQGTKPEAEVESDNLDATSSVERDYTEQISSEADKVTPSNDHPNGGLVAAARRALEDENNPESEHCSRNVSAEPGFENADSSIMGSAAEGRENFNDSPAEETVKKEEPQQLGVVTLILKAPEKMPFHGYELLQSLLSFGLRFGRRNIFHRYHNIHANKKIMFSVAQLHNPGTFELERMGGRRYPGLVFFMSRELGLFNIIVFEQMLQTLKGLQEELGGELLSGDGTELSAQQLASLRSVLREVSSEDDIMPVSTDATGSIQDEQETN